MDDVDVPFDPHAEFDTAGRPIRWQTRPVVWMPWQPVLYSAHLAAVGQSPCPRCGAAEHTPEASSSLGKALPATGWRFYATRHPCGHVRVYDRGDTGQGFTEITDAAHRLF